MKSFLYRWLWEGKQKWLVLFSFISFCLWVGAYSLVYYWVPNYCPALGNECYVFWLSMIGKPFYWGYFLKALMIAPLCILPFSKMVFRMWLLFAALCIPVAVLSTMYVPSSFILDKLAMSHVWGIIFFLGTLIVITLATLAEWLYKKFKESKIKRAP